MKKGLFITFEGIDGCGKSTQLAEAARLLLQEGIAVITTREPGGTPIAEKIRQILISAEHSEMDDRCELLLYLAARAQHVAEKIRPALQSGQIVLCDRFQEATYAYQGFGRKLDMDLLTEINQFATGGLSPDLTFIFDIPVELSQVRLKAANKQQDRLEQNPPEIFARIRDGYHWLSKAHPDRIVLLDGQRSVQELASSVVGRIRQSLHTSEIGAGKNGN